MDRIPTTWLVIGFLGQAIFTARFLVQWVASERKRDSIIPVAFWWLSLAGGTTLLVYATFRQDPVIMVGQSLGVFIYVRNLMLVAKGKRRADKLAKRQTGHEEKPELPSRPIRVDAGESSTHGYKGSGSLSAVSDQRRALSR